MITYKNCGAILCVTLSAWRLVACSASTGKGQGGGLFTGAGGASVGNPSAGGNGFAGNAGNPGFAAGSNGTGSTGSVIHIKDSGTSIRTTDSSCGAIPEKPEQITVYTEASVTDTIVSYTPVALFIMLDRSTSMITPPIGQTVASWTNSVNAVTAFVKDPMSAGLDIGLGTFPAGPNNTYDCATGADCGTPVVPIASLPNNATPMIDAMTAQMPNPLALAFTPTECALRGMINQCLQYKAASPSGENCVAVLVTDGTPTQCDVTAQNLINIITDGKMKGVDTYTLGLPGSDINTLNSYAQAGGTGMAIDVSAGSMAFVAALNSIRGKISHQDHHTVVTSHVVQTPLKCEWKIPPQAAGSPALDPQKVNLQFTPPGGASVQFGHVANMAACPPTENAWYYDNETNPMEIFLCPNTCTNVENVMGAEINILLHCPRIEAVPA